MTNELSVMSEDIFYRWNEHYRIIEAVDSISGRVIAIQEDFHEEHALNPENMMEVILDGTKILVQKGMSISNYVPPKLNYSKPIADIVVQRISEGDTLKKAIRGTGVSAGTVLSWSTKITSFGDELARARLVRAEMIQDTILEAAEEMSAGGISKGDLDAKSKSMDLYKWSAEKDSPNRFGNKKDQGSGGATVINIITGVVRDEPLTVEVVSD